MTEQESIRYQRKEDKTWLHCDIVVVHMALAQRVSIRSDVERYLQEVQVREGDYRASYTTHILPENSVVACVRLEVVEGASFRKVDDYVDGSGVEVDIHRYFEFVRGSW